MTSPAPPAPDRPAIEKLRRALAAAGFTHEGLERALGPDAAPTLSDAPVALRRLPAGLPLSTLVRLFVLELPVAAGEADEALAPLSTAEAERLGLVRIEDGVVEPLVRLMPSGELVFASDRRETADFVMGVAPSSALLGNLTVRRPVARALDVGTGSGIQAVLAARHAGRVIATDLNGRALAFAAFNALLNGCENVELRQGSFFEPVAGERFDLVVSNPPFVISPDLEFAYRDAGMRGDEVSELLVRESARHLAEGGLATILVTWTHETGGDWSAPLRSWVAGSGCDAVLLRYTSDDPLGYAARWNPPARTPDPVTLGATIDRWLTYFRELGIEAIAYGAAFLRRREGSNWVLATDAPERITPAAEHLERLIDAQDFLAETPDLADARLRLVPDHLLEQALRLDDGAFTVQSATMRLLEGLGFQARIDVTIGHLLSGFDGRRTVREAAAGTAAALSPEGVGPDALLARALPAVRRMVELGFLAPARV